MTEEIGFNDAKLTPQPTGSRWKFRQMFGRVCNMVDDWRPAGMVIFGDCRNTYQQCLAKNIPYVLVENDVASLRYKTGPTEEERTMIENAKAMLLTSEGHYDYLAEHYRIPPTEIVHLRPLAECLDFEPLPKQPRTAVYGGGVVGKVESNFAYRGYYLEIFPAIIAAGWQVHVYSTSNWFRNHEAHAYTDIGCVLHEGVNQAELYREFSQYAVGYQGYAEHAPQQYVAKCRPNKLWEYLAAGIPTLGYNPGDGGVIYDGKWGLVVPTLQAIPATLRRLESWQIDEGLRRREVIDQDEPVFRRLIGHLTRVRPGRAVRKNRRPSPKKMKTMRMDAKTKKRLWLMSNTGGEPCDYEDLADAAAIEPTIDRTPEQFAGAFLTAFRLACNEALAAANAEGRQLLVFHSGGYDSRVLGWHVHDRLPENAIWACMHPEHAEFLAIMKRWYKHQRHVLVPTKQVQGVSRMPAVFGWIEQHTEWRRQNGLVLKAGYFDELFHNPWRWTGAATGTMGDFREWVQFYHNGMMAGDASLVPTIYPILHPAPLRVILESRTQLGRALKTTMLRASNPELYSMPRTPGI